MTDLRKALLNGRTYSTNAIGLCSYLHPIEKAILNILEMAKFNKDYADASIRQMARIIGRAKSTIQKYIKSLQDKKIINKQLRYGYMNMKIANRYTFCRNFEDVMRCETLEEAQATMEADISPKEAKIKKFKKYVHVKHEVKHEAKHEAETVDVKENINYNAVTATLDEDSISLLDACVNVAQNAVNSKRKDFKIKGILVKKDTVVKRMKELTKEDVLYVVERFKSLNLNVINTEQYLLTMLYCAKEQRKIDEIRKKYDKNLDASTMQQVDKMKNRFHNFTQREGFDYDALLHKLNGLE